jgi:glycosyltransferase involved in cell wall biosynthesis
MSETKEDDARRIWWKELVKRRRLRAASAALVGGQKQRDYLVKLGIARERIFFGYDVVDNAYFSRGASEARAKAGPIRRQHRLPERYFFVCTRFLPRKNVDGLLRAYAAYRSKCREPWDLVIAGSGTQQPALRRLEENLGVKGVAWCGFIQYEQLPIYYGLASAFIHPATTEPWGLVVNEAAACGLPLLVSSTVGAGYELVVEGENGWLFDPLDTNDLASTMTRMTEADAARIVTMGQAAAATAEQWSPQRFGIGLLNAIATLQRGRRN